MASPQLENGYTTISNELMEALARIRINGEAWQVLNVIFRQIYGWRGKKSDKISNSQFRLKTGLSKVAVSRAIKKLKDINIISVIKIDNKSISLYSINKDFSTWKSLSKLITNNKSVIKIDNNVPTKSNNINTLDEKNCNISEQDSLSKLITPVIKIDNKLLSKMIPTKTIYTKTTITKEEDIPPTPLKTENEITLENPVEEKKPIKQKNKPVQFSSQFLVAWDNWQHRAKPTPKDETYKRWKSQIARLDITEDDFLKMVLNYCEFVKLKCQLDKSEIKYLQGFAYALENKLEPAKTVDFTEFSDELLPQKLSKLREECSYNHNGGRNNEPKRDPYFDMSKKELERVREAKRRLEESLAQGDDNTALRQSEDDEFI